MWESADFKISQLKLLNFAQMWLFNTNPKTVTVVINAFKYQNNSREKITVLKHFHEIITCSSNHRANSQLNSLTLIKYFLDIKHKDQERFK